MIPKLLVNNNIEEIQKYIDLLIKQFLVSPFDITSLGQNNYSIKIDLVRELKQKLNLKPWSGTKKVTIIYNAHHLTNEAQNAMLKILEEPLEDTIIILACPNENLLLPTIISRCEIVRIESKDMVRSKTGGEDGQMDIGEKFKLAEELSKKIDKDETLEATRKRVEEWFATTIAETQPSPATAKNLKILLSAQKQIRQNLNMRLVLENYFLNSLKK